MMKMKIKPNGQYDFSHLPTRLIAAFTLTFVACVAVIAALVFVCLVVTKSLWVLPIVVVIVFGLAFLTCNPKDPF